MGDARYGLGWRIYKYGENGDRVIGHRGAVEGYRSYILFDPERDTGVVILWNSSSRLPNGIGFEVMDMVYGLPAQRTGGIFRIHQSGHGWLTSQSRLFDPS